MSENPEWLEDARRKAAAPAAAGGLPRLDRFHFQRECAAATTGRVLNAGCKEDPAQLRGTFGLRVLNLDLRDHDHDALWNRGERLPIPVDVLWDLTRIPWPFAESVFELVVLGDILEDLPDDGCQPAILGEAGRVARRLCVTCPEDSVERDWHHLTTVTEERLRGWLREAGWRPLRFLVVDYLFVPRGYLVEADR